MSIAGMMAIVAGWLMIMPLHRTEPATAHSSRWHRYALIFLGACMLTAGMATMVEARF